MNPVLQVERGWGNREGGFHPRWVIALFFFALSLTVATAQDDLFKEKFVSNLKAMASAPDAVVGVAIKDLRSGDEFIINGDEVFPQASAIKIHILAELYRQAEQGKYRLSDVIPVPSSSRVGGSGILNELGSAGVSMSIRDYAILMIVLSDNTATNLLIERVGMENVNRFLQSVGATRTKLQRVMMDLKAATEGRENIGTPREVMNVLEKMYRGELVSKSASAEMLSILRKAKDGPLRAGIPESVDLADKAGDVDGVKCDVGIVLLQDAPYIICVMTKLLQNADEGPKVITGISRLTYQYFERKGNSNQFGRRLRR
jgi:beta-lactamase class A